MRCLCTYLLLLMVVQTIEGPTEDVPAGSMHVWSPISGQQLARGQDLVVKYAVGEDGQACRVVLVVNGRVLATQNACKASVAVPEHELAVGPNVVELFRQGDDQGQAQEASVNFEVVHPPLWPNLPFDEVGVDESCKDGNAVCSRKTCIHRVRDACVLYDDAWARAHGSVPRILHWVWVGGGGEIPAKFRPMMDSWRTLHPEWQTVIWTDDKVTWELRNSALMLQADTYAELSDIVRLEVVERFGGVYIDTDFEALQVT